VGSAEEVDRMGRRRERGRCLMFQKGEIDVVQRGGERCGRYTTIMRGEEGEGHLLTS